MYTFFSSNKISKHVNVMPWLQVGLFVNIVFVYSVIEAERDYIICPVDKRKK